MRDKPAERATADSAVTAEMRALSSDGVPHFLRVLRRHLPILLISAVVVPVTAFAVSALGRETYTAASYLLFRQSPVEQVFGASPATTDPNREAATNFRLARLEVVRERTAARLRIPIGVVDSAVSVSSSGQADVVAITASSSDPQQAAALANAFATEFIAYRRDADRKSVTAALRYVQRQLEHRRGADPNSPEVQSLQQRADALEALASLPATDVELAQAASVPTAPTSPRPVRNMILAVPLGLLVGIGLAFARERLGTRIRSPEEVEELLGKPILARVPTSRALAVVHGQPFVPTSDDAGVFAALWTKLRYFTPAPVQSVLVTSASRGEGKTTVALQLAAAAAPNGRILLVEADFHHPTLGQRLGLSGLGLSDLLVGVVGVESCLKSVAAGDRDEAPASFDVLLAGTKPPYPLSLMDSPSLQAFLSEVDDAYEAVILDCPPLVSSPDAIPLVRLVSGVVVVAHARRTSRRAVAELRDILESLGAYVFGEVINGARTHDEFREHRYART